MNCINVKNIKVGEEYYFVDTHFVYANINLLEISKEKIYRIVNNEFSTKNDDDKYETIRVIGFRTKEEAQKYALKELKEYKKWYNKQIDNIISQLISSTNK